MGKVYDLALEFKKKYPNTISRRIKKHAKVIEDYVNPDEEVLYAFCGQKGNEISDFFRTCVVAVTDKRLLIGQKRVVWGSFYSQITPELYNDMQVYSGLFFGKVTIDTVKEKLYISGLSKASLDEIETAISTLMIKNNEEN